ncbi:probable oxidoreductase, LLM family [Aliicoccus persicus]|uniref:Probable oxidoreductase, LLM family n=1 Tax=Aliicoccus persicus TaxID=930138 RepID=A0A662Z4F6_9STAP|nr:probable oxidoreductase, LLM family [Aliicoccus persicus]
MTIEFGISSFGDVESPTGSVPHAQRLQEIIEEMKMTDKVGLDIFAIGEHHRKDYAVSSPDTLLAAGAAVTKNIRLSTAVTVLSSEDPVRVWERFATIDGISNGRAEIMAGRGSFIESFPLFGYDLNDYEQLFEEKLALLVELQKGHRDKLPVTFRGELQHSVENITLYPNTVQETLPIWIAAGGSPGSAVRAAKYGLPLMLAVIGGSPYQFRDFIDLYKRTWVNSNHKIEDFQFGLNMHGFIADTNEEAKEIYFPAASHMMNRIGMERGWGSTYTENYFDRLTSETGALLVGDVETVAQKLSTFIRALGVTRFVMQTPVGYIDHEAVLKNIELFGTKVVPRVKELLAEEN